VAISVSSHRAGRALQGLDVLGVEAVAQLVIVAGEQMPVAVEREGD
jgi:hypothetical protein